MDTSFACPSCGTPGSAPLARAGQSVRCTGCGRPVVVPAPREVAGPEPAPRPAAPTVKFACPSCGRKFSTRAEFAGKRIVCGGCGTKIAVPGAPSPAPPSGAALPSRPAPASSLGGRPHAPKPTAPVAAVAPAVDLFDLADAAPEPASARPRARARAGGEEVVESVLPSRSQAMEEVEREVAEKAKLKEEKSKKKARKKKTKSSGGLEPKEVAQIIGGGFAVITVLSLLAYAAPATRLVVGGSLCAVGGLAYLIGTLGFASIARQEGAMYSLACKFVPLYKWYYLWSRWEEMKGHFALYAVGLILLTPGWFIIQESPYYNRLDAMEESQMAKALERAGLEPAPPAGVVPVPPGGDGGDDVE